MQTKVPAHVKERYERLAAVREISLSMLFEELIDEFYPHITGTAEGDRSRADLINT
ncbi:hypothetical protein [Microtetraspora malaysiensis]|uniref:hypothetical protein n=1 Tax=Microtetraspora malaysiensis TaxID=161358 RepID=UPI003D93540F